MNRPTQSGRTASGESGATTSVGAGSPAGFEAASARALSAAFVRLRRHSGISSAMDDRRSRISMIATSAESPSAVAACVATAEARLASTRVLISVVSQIMVQTSAISHGNGFMRAAIASAIGGRRHDGRLLASSARPSPTTKPGKIMNIATASPNRSASAPQSPASCSAFQPHWAARPTISDVAATVVNASSERRSRPSGNIRAASLVSPCSAPQLPMNASRSAPISDAITLPRSGPRNAVDRPVRISVIRLVRRVLSAGQAAAMLRQNSVPTGELARSSRRASNRARRWLRRSVPRCWASTATSRASRMSASSALRSFSRAVRWRVTSGSSVPAPLAGAVPSSPSRAFRSASGPVREATKRCACELMSSVSAIRAATSSPLSSIVCGILSSCARIAGTVLSGTASGACAADAALEAAGAGAGVAAGSAADAVPVKARLVSRKMAASPR